MFRPRFRLSLLFIVAALVAGVSVWLRQAVVRDRNIRALLAEEWVSGIVDSGESDKAIHLNTKILNYFLVKPDYCDHIEYLQIYIHRIKSPDAILKYQDLDLGTDLPALVFSPEEGEVLFNNFMSANSPISTKQISFWLSRFHNIDRIMIYRAKLLDDVTDKWIITGSCQEFSIQHCETDTSTLIKLFESFSKLPKQITLVRNNIRGKPSDLRILDTQENRRDYAKENYFE